AMRTGQLDASKDRLSEIWFGNGYLFAFGAPATTTKFHGNIFEGDVQLRCPRGHLKVAGGYLYFDDNDTTASHKRSVYFYYVEGLWNATQRFYSASRFSQILAGDGFSIFGNTMSFGLSTDLWRLSMGAGFRFNPNLILKIEGSLERGRKLSGPPRDDEDFIGA